MLSKDQIERLQSIGDYMPLWLDLLSRLPRCSDCRSPSTRIDDPVSERPSYRCDAHATPEKHAHWEDTAWAPHVRTWGNVLGGGQTGEVEAAKVPTVKRVLRVSGSGGRDEDVILDVAEGVDMEALARYETEARGSWCDFVEPDLIEAELRAALHDAAYLLSTGKESHRAHGEKLRAEALETAKALGLDLEGSTLTKPA